jgi:mRNA interferase YafQ
MFVLITTKQFEKDYKLCLKRGYKIRELTILFESLEKSGCVPSKYKAHKLSGDFKEHWECHIRPDWLLIWFKNESQKEIVLTRTGTHSDLF